MENWLDKYDVGGPVIKTDATRVAAPTVRFTKKQLEESKAKAKQVTEITNKANAKKLAERKKAVAESSDANIINPNGKRFAIGDKFRLFPNDVSGVGEVFDNFINPFVFTGNTASALGNAMIDRDPKALAIEAGMALGAGALGFDPLGSAMKLPGKLDKVIYPTRTYRSVVPGGNKLSYESSELADKVFSKGDWTTRDLRDAVQYLSGNEMEGGRRGLLTGNDMLFTEYKVPFWKKSVAYDPDVIALKKLQGDVPDPNEFIIPNNKFLYPRRTNLIKAVPEHVKEATATNVYGEPFTLYQPGKGIFSYEDVQYTSPAYKYVEDQLNAVTGQQMPYTFDYNDLRRGIPPKMHSWEQPQFAPNEGMGSFSPFENGGHLDKYDVGGELDPFGLTTVKKDVTNRATPRVLTPEENKRVAENRKRKAAEEAAKNRPQLSADTISPEQRAEARRRRERQEYINNSQIAQTLQSFTTNTNPNLGGIGASTAAASMLGAGAGAAGVAGANWLASNVLPYVGPALSTPAAKAIGNVLGAGFATKGVMNLPTVGESIQTAYQDPSLANIGNAALETGVTALDLYPLASGVKSAIGEGVSAINASKESGLLSNAYKINPWATKIDDAGSKIVGEGTGSFIYDPAKRRYSRTYEVKPNFLTGYKKIKDPSQLDFSPIIEPRTQQLKDEVLEQFKPLKALTGGTGETIDLKQFIDYAKAQDEKIYLKYKYQDFLDDLYSEKYNRGNRTAVFNQSRNETDAIVREIDEAIKQKYTSLGKKLGSGVEGEVYELADDPNNVIKIGETIQTDDAEDLVKSFEGITDDNIARVNRAYKEGKYLVEMMPNLNANPKFSNFTREQVLDKLEKDVRGLMDKGFRLDVDNIHGNFKYNPEKNKIDIYDISKPAPGQNYQNQDIVIEMLREHFGDKYVRMPSGNHPLYDPNMPTPEFKNGGWLDKYDDGGEVEGEDKEKYVDPNHIPLSKNRQLFAALKANITSIPLIDNMLNGLTSVPKGIYNLAETAAAQLYTNQTPQQKEEIFQKHRPMDYPGFGAAARSFLHDGPPRMDDKGNLAIEEEAWRKALNLPTKSNYIRESKYRPTSATDPNAKYYTFHPNVIDSQKLIDYVNSDVWDKNKKKSKSGKEYLQMSSLVPFMKQDFIDRQFFDEGQSMADYDPLQNFQVYKGYDPVKKKNYISISDRYDFNSKPVQAVIKPYDFYDRFYYEDGGKIQENYNDYSLSAPEGFVGSGTFDEGRDYSPAWGGQFKEGGPVKKFLQPTQTFQNIGYNPRENGISTEYSTTVGKDGEYYLVPGFKQGRLVEDPEGLFNFTGEHLGGPFKTIQSAEDFAKFRHGYVEKNKNIPLIFKTRDYAMGGSMPGAVGFTYARTNDPAPSNGKYAKKTMASAQNGTEIGPDGIPIDNKKMPPKSLYKKLKKTANETEDTLQDYLNLDDAIQSAQMYIHDNDPRNDWGLHNGPLDAVRHTASAAQTSSQLANMLPGMKYNPGVMLSSILATNALGVAHELSSPNDWKERASDLYNNLAGSIIGVLPGNESKRNERIKSSLNNDLLSNLHGSGDMKPFDPKFKNKLTKPKDKVEPKTFIRGKGPLSNETLDSMDFSRTLQRFHLENGGQLTKLDQLTNFTNYNTKQPGGWLDKYK